MLLTMSTVELHILILREDTLVTTDRPQHSELS